MPLSRTIPAALHAEVARLRASTNPATNLPWTSREVARRLRDDHGVRCSHMAVLRLEARLSERGDALIAEALRGQLRDAVGPMLGRVARATKRLDALCRKERRLDRLAAGARALTDALREVAKLGGVAAAAKHELGTDGLAEFLSAAFQEGPGPKPP